MNPDMFNKYTQYERPISSYLWPSSYSPHAYYDTMIKRTKERRKGEYAADGEHATSDKILILMGVTAFIAIIIGA